VTSTETASTSPQPPGEAQRIVVSLKYLAVMYFGGMGLFKALNLHLNSSGLLRSENLSPNNLIAVPPVIGPADGLIPVSFESW
jgi:hypothetical protein